MASENVTRRTGRKVKRAASTTARPAGMWDVENYFDANFTATEREVLRDKLRVVCGYESPYGAARFEYDIERPAQDSIWPVFAAQGLDYDRDHDRLCDYTLIHICRELQVEYKSFAANKPKLPIDGFVECAKRSFPAFKQPRNAIERKIQEHKLHALWTEWRDEECERTGCSCDHHWLCSDRFVTLDDAAILAEVAAYNETRPKYAAPKLVYSRE